MITTMDKLREKYLTTSEASKIVGISEEYIRLLCEKGTISGAMKFGKIWIIPRSEIKKIPKPAPKPNPQYIHEINQAIKKAMAQVKQQNDIKI